VLSDSGQEGLGILVAPMLHGKGRALLLAIQAGGGLEGPAQMPSCMQRHIPWH
jgi:hypothetical protein